MSSYQGDYAVNSVVDVKWNTSGQDGASITRSTDGTLRIYKNNSTTERTSLAGVTQTEDFDGTTGLHHLRIDLSDNTDAGFYVAGSEISVVMAGMVIDTKTVNAEIASFSIERTGGALALIKSRLVGTIAAGTHNPQGGDAFARLGAPTGASISADLVTLQADTDNLQTRLPTTLVSGRIDASVGAMAANVLTATAINADAITAAKIADGALDANTFVAGSLNGKGDWNIGKTGYALSAAGNQAIWDVLDSAIALASSIGIRLKNFITGDSFGRLGAPTGASISADIQTRATQTSVDAIDTFLDTEVVTVDEMAEALVGPQATVVANGSNTATTFQVTITTVSEAAADWWKDAWFSFDLTAALAGQTKKVANFNQSTGMITMASAFTNVPTAGNTARLVTR